MRLVLILICFAALAAGLMNYWAASEPGYVYISWFGYSVEMTVWLFLVTFLALVFLCFFIIKFAYVTIRLPMSLRSWLFSYDEGKLQSQTSHALAAYEEGHWQRARKLLVRIAERSKNPLVFYLMAAKASHELGEKDQVNAYLKQANQVVSSSMAASLVQAQLQLADGVLDGCLATLVRAKAIEDEHPQVVKMLAQVYSGLKDWQNLYILLSQFKRLKLGDAQYQAYLEQAVTGLLNEASKVDINALIKQWQKLNETAHASSALVLVYADLLIAMTHSSQAFKTLKSFLSVNKPSAKVFLKFAEIATEDPQSAMQFVHKILSKKEPDMAELLTLSRLALLNKLDGQYKSYLAKASDAAQIDDETWVRAQLTIELLRAEPSKANGKALQQLTQLSDSLA